MSKVLMAYGRGTHSGASNTNGGGWERNTSRSWTDSQDANGGPIDTTNSATITNNGSGSVRITSAGNFSNSLIDLYVYVDFAATYTDGRYKITAVDVSGNYIDIDLTYSADTTATLVNVGGALLDQHGMGLALGQGDVGKIPNDTILTNANGSNYMFESTVIVTGATDYDKFLNRIKIEGVDDVTGIVDFDNPTKFNAATTNLGIRCFTNYDYVGLECYNTSSGSVFDTTGGQDRINYIGCIAHDSGGGNVGFSGDDGVVAIGCLAYNNNLGGFLFDNDSEAMYCTAYDNGGVGIDMDGNAKIVGCNSYNNTTGQIQCNYGAVSDNIVWNEDDDNSFGIYVDEQNFYQHDIYRNVIDMKSRTGSIGLKVFNIVNTASTPRIMNNVLINCETGVATGNTWNGKAFYLNNCFFNNTTDRDTESSDYGEAYNEITSDPLFTDTLNNDYTLQSSSPLKGSALDFNFMLPLQSNTIASGYYDGIGGAAASGGLLMANKRGNKQ